MIGFISSLSIPAMIAAIVAYGLATRTDVYNSFAEGAKLGLENVFRIVPPLVGLIVGISMLRASGAMDVAVRVLQPVTSLLHMPSEVLPLALLRPVSGSGSIAIVNDIFSECGPDSLQGKIASVMMGSTETTFYTIAVYFGAVGVKNIRHTAKAALLADLTGMICAVFFVNLLFI